MFLLALWIGKLTLFLTRLIGNSGTALPGLVVEKLSPGFLEKAGSQLAQGSVVITGTNGKTTTTKIVQQILEATGQRVLANRGGSNFSRGIVSSMVAKMDLRGRLNADIGVFEVDEAFMPEVATKLKPKAALVLNLLRDQLDRYGELNTTARYIGTALQQIPIAVLNSSDPLVAALSADKPAEQVTYFGMSSDLEHELPHDQMLLYQDEGGHEGPLADVKLVRSNTESFGQELSLEIRGTKYSVNSKLEGAFNALNIAAAVALVSRLGIGPEAALRAVQEVEPPFGRSEIVNIDGKELQLLLVKNPAAFNQILKNYLAPREQQKVLMLVNDNFADGRDVSWLWDVDFEMIGRQKHQIQTAGTRGYDLAVRLKYADMTAEPSVGIDEPLNNFLAGLAPGERGYVIPTYTALLAVRKSLSKRAKLPEMWQ